ncbi:MAG: hypothetical protein QXU99_00340 [Candidatus Bathyarchaeia archaeon]
MIDEDFSEFLAYKVNVVANSLGNIEFLCKSSMKGIMFVGSLKVRLNIEYAKLSMKIWELSSGIAQMG